MGRQRGSWGAGKAPEAAREGATLEAATAATLAAAAAAAAGGRGSYRAREKEEGVGGRRKGDFLFLVFGGLRELGRGELLPNYATPSQGIILVYGMVCMVQRQMHAAPPSLV